MTRATALALAVLDCGGRVPQSQTCSDYVDCAGKTGITADTKPNDYAPEGACWVDQQTADNCTAAYKGAIASLKSSGIAADAGCTFSN